MKYDVYVWLKITWSINLSWCLLELWIVIWSYIPKKIGFMLSLNLYIFQAIFWRYTVSQTCFNIDNQLVVCYHTQASIVSDLFTYNCSLPNCFLFIKLLYKALLSTFLTHFCYIFWIYSSITKSVIKNYNAENKFLKK